MFLKKVIQTLFLLLIIIPIRSQTTLYFDNCNALGGWTNTGGMFPGNIGGFNWLSVDPITPPDDHTIGGNCFYVNGNTNYLEAGAGRYIIYQLRSPVINLTGYDNTRLEFWMQMRSEVGNWDGGYVEVSTNGVNWTQLTNAQLCVPYDGNMSQNGSSTPYFPLTTPAWWNPRLTWTRVVANISAFDNVPTFYMRYTFHSDEAANDLGWTIDDIKIVSIALPQVQGNSLIIADNDLTPTPADFTDFGSVPIGGSLVRTFFIYNIGESPLTLTGTPMVTVTGTGFTVLNQPANNVIPPGGFVTFDVEFSPTIVGVINGTVNIPNSDDYSSCSPPNPYNFAIRGQNENTPPFASTWINDTIICPGSGPVVFNYTIDDIEQNPNTINVSVSSSDQNIVPNGNILSGGAGFNQSLTITPNVGQSGSTTITVTLNDGQAVNPDSVFTFVLTVDDQEVPLAVCQNVQVQLDNNGNGSLIPAQVDNGSSDNCGIQNISISQSQFNCNDVGIQNLTFTVTDINGNTSDCLFTAEILPPVMNVSYVVSDFNGYQISCFGFNDGSIQINTTGGCPPYTYSWTHDPLFNLSSANSLTQGNYQITITDASGQQQTLNISLTEPAELTDQSSKNDISCYGELDGSINLNATGGVLPYIYSQGPIITGLSSGVYNYQITDANNCIIPVTLSIVEPPAINISGIDYFSIYCGENIAMDVSATGGTGNLTYNWDNSSFLSCNPCEDPVASPNKSTVFTLTVIDEMGCTETYSVLIEVDCNLFIPNSFTPNLDANNEMFQVYAGGVRQFEMRIFNRWGQEIFTTQDIQQGWDGNFQNEKAPMGIYVYDIYVVMPSGEERNLRGHINLIR